MPMPKKWFMKFSNTKKVDIVPFDPKVTKLVKEFEKKLHRIVGKSVDICDIQHRGATALRISGKGEVDLHIRVPGSRFDSVLNKMTKRFGQPGWSERSRIRFNHMYKGTEFEMQLIRKNSMVDKQGIRIFEYLRDNPAALKKYELMKKKHARISKRAYYTWKDKFYGKLLKGPKPRNREKARA